jgi:hypothetical protein
MRKVHKHQDPKTNVLRDCNDAECKLPFRTPAPKAKQQKTKHVKRDAMWNYGRVIYDSDRF